VAPWRASPPVTIISAFVTTRVALILVGLLALSSLSIDAAHALTNCVTQPPAPAALEMWSRWDAPWYLVVAEQGYGGTLDAYCDMRSTRFPLYPILIWAVRPVLGHSLLAGLVVSNAALVAFLFALWRLVEIDYGQQVSARAIWLYLLFPSSLFLSGVYAESLMLAATVGAIVAARGSKWACAGLLAAAALLSHPVGALVLLPVTIECLAFHGYKVRFIRAREVGWLLLPATAALAGYFVFADRTFGNPLAGLATQAEYRGAIGWPGQAFVGFWQSGPRWHGYDNSIFDASLAVAALASLVSVFKRLRLSYALYATASVLVPLSTSLVSFSRIVLGAFPCFVLVALFTRRNAVFLPVLTASGILLCVLTMMFATWRWVA
jgi:hypothetical protein